MRLVLDTNILIAALIKDALTRKILIHPELEFVVSEYIFGICLAPSGVFLPHKWAHPASERLSFVNFSRDTHKASRLRR